MAGYVGRWMAREVGDSLLVSNPDVSQKYKMGDISKGAAKHSIQTKK
jgi:hypothetical protein